MKIKRGVIQDCILSPLWFNLYSEVIFSGALQNTIECIKVNGELIISMRYAVDTDAITDNEHNLQSLLSKIRAKGEK